MTLRLFLNRKLLDTVDSSPTISKKKLTNTINHLHFTNGSILVHVNDCKYQEELVVECFLESCTADEIRCRWPEGAPSLSENGQPHHLILHDGLSLILCPIQITGISGSEFSATLPETGYLLGKRRIRRHSGQDVKVTLTQNSFLAQGTLILKFNTFR